MSPTKYVKSNCSVCETCTESNETLKRKFRKLFEKIIDGVDVDKVAPFLFQEAVIDTSDMENLKTIRVSRAKCEHLLLLLFHSGNPEAFVKLYHAIRKDTGLNWLAKEIDTMTDPKETPSSREPPRPGSARYRATASSGRDIGDLGEPVLGVTSLDGEINVLRGKLVCKVEVYDAISYRFKRNRTVNKSTRGLVDITSCKSLHYVYIANDHLSCVYRLDAKGSCYQWNNGDEPESLSVNAAGNLLVTCSKTHKIKEFDSLGTLMGEVSFPDDVLNPRHTVQYRLQFVVCHGNRDDATHRVCTIKGHKVIYSHGGRRGSDITQYNEPVRLAVCSEDGHVLVADLHNKRVTLLSPKLEYVREVVSPSQFNWLPARLCYDEPQRKLYVADNEWKNNEWSAGCVKEFDV